MPSVNAVQHKSSWAALGHVPANITFHSDYSFSTTSTQCNPGRGGTPQPWPNLSQLSVGQVQVNFCFSFACHNASLECFLWWFCSTLPGGRGKESSSVGGSSCCGVCKAPWFVALLHTCGMFVLFTISLSLFLPLFLPLFLSVQLCHCLFILHAFSRAFPRFVGQNKRQAVSRERASEEGRADSARRKQSKEKQSLALLMAFQHYFLICPALYLGLSDFLCFLRSLSFLLLFFLQSTLDELLRAAHKVDSPLCQLLNFHLFTY